MLIHFWFWNVFPLWNVNYCKNIERYEVHNVHQRLPQSISWAKCPHSHMVGLALHLYKHLDAWYMSVSKCVFSHCPNGVFVIKTLLRFIRLYNEFNCSTNWAIFFSRLFCCCWYKIYFYADAHRIPTTQVQSCFYAGCGNSTYNYFWSKLYV